MCARFSWESWLTLNKWCWRSLEAAAGLDGEGFSHQETDTKPGGCPAVCGHLCLARPNIHGQAVEFSPQLPRAGGVPHTGRSQGWLEMVADIPATLQWGFGHPWDRLVRSGCNVCLWCLSHWGRGVVSGPSYPHRVPGIHSRAGDAH